MVEQCTGLDQQKRECGQNAGIVISAENTSAGAGDVVVGVIVGFVFGAAVGAVIVYYFFVYRRHSARGSPHYVSAKSQNLYVSLPMLDLKHRHFSSNQSDCDTLRSTTTHGTLRSKASVGSIYANNGASAGIHQRHDSSTPSDYETATIKRSRSHRNSSILNGTMRADLDSDQLFS